MMLEHMVCSECGAVFDEEPVEDFWCVGQAEVAATGITTPLVSGYSLQGWLDEGSSPFVPGTSGH